MISLATETERTLFFDFLPLSLGEIRGFKTRFHLYTVPGQVFYDASRKLILKGVDGVVFVADSQIERMEANIESLENLRINLAEQGYDLDKLPYVVQYNKRDLPNAAPIEQLREVLNPTKARRVRGLRHQRRRRVRHAEGRRQGRPDRAQARQLVARVAGSVGFRRSVRPAWRCRSRLPDDRGREEARRCAAWPAARSGRGSRARSARRRCRDRGEEQRARDAEAEAGQRGAQARDAVEQDGQRRAGSSALQSSGLPWPTPTALATSCGEARRQQRRPPACADEHAGRAGRTGPTSRRPAPPAKPPRPADRAAPAPAHQQRRPAARAPPPSPSSPAPRPSCDLLQRRRRVDDAGAVVVVDAPVAVVAAAPWACAPCPSRTSSTASGLRHARADDQRGHAGDVRRRHRRAHEPQVVGLRGVAGDDRVSAGRRRACRRRSGRRACCRPAPRCRSPCPSSSRTSSSRRTASRRRR